MKNIGKKNILPAIMSANKMVAKMTIQRNNKLLFSIFGGNLFYFHKLHFLVGPIQ